MKKLTIKKVFCKYLLVYINAVTYPSMLKLDWYQPELLLEIPEETLYCLYRQAYTTATGKIFNSKIDNELIISSLYSSKLGVACPMYDQEYDQHFMRISRDHVRLLGE
jgi:hypothetical protein